MPKTDLRYLNSRQVKAFSIYPSLHFPGHPLYILLRTGELTQKWSFQIAPNYLRQSCLASTLVTQNGNEKAGKNTPRAEQLHSPMSRKN